MSTYRGFKPKWETTPPPRGSFRSILKWGDPNETKEPNEGLFKLVKARFGLDDRDFTEKSLEGINAVPAEPLSQIEDEHRGFFVQLIGSDNVLDDAYHRLKYSYGKTMWDLYRLREGQIENLPELVLRPGTHDEIQGIINYCDEHRLPIYVYGGGSSVTRGMEAVKGGVSLDLSTRFTDVLGFDPVNRTVTVQAGISGPDLESYLHERGLTCGHFPQSFEYSSVGGWVVTRGAGQNSTYYGNIKDMVYGQKYATPVGTVRSYHLPAHAVGPDIDEIMMGSEGAFGVLTEVTLKVFSDTSGNRRKFSYIFPTWDAARNAAREIMQAEAGYPSVFRISDPEESDVMLRFYQVDGTVLDKAMGVMGFKPMERCLFLGWSEGERGYAQNVAKIVGRICRRYGAMALGSYPVSKWEHGRFRDPYLRDALQDYGIIIDTMECSVSWESMERVHEGVRAFAKSRPDTICMTHISHAYPQGANLYFIFIGRFQSKEEYLEYQSGIFDNIRHFGASMSHHHGVGKATAPWVADSIGPNQLDIFRALKRHFDPNGIMNPGGTLGLEPESPRRKPRFAARTWDDPAY